MSVAHSPLASPSLRPAPAHPQRTTSAPLEALWALAHDDAAAKTELLRQLLRVLRGLVRRDLDARNYFLGEDDVDDVVQDLFIEVWERDLERFDPEKGSMLSFLKTRVRWRVADAVRRLARARSESLDEALENDSFDVVCPLPTPDHRCLDSERTRHLRLVRSVADEALATMDDDAARVSVQMHDLDGAPLRDVARTLNVHPSNATRARQRGLRCIALALPPVVREAA